jgi:hypothetical protein
LEILDSGAHTRCIDEDYRMSDEKKSLEGAVTAVLASDDTKALVADYAEIGIDALLNDGVAREIPVISTLIGIARIGMTIRDRRFAKKLLELLKPFAQVSASERQAMIAKLESDPQYGRKVGDHLIEIVDRIDLHRKPPMIAAIFLAYQQAKIDAQMLHRLNHAVDRLPHFEIDALRPFCEAPPETRDAPLATLQNLQTAGLVNALSGFGGLVFEPNDVSKAFLMLDLDKIK